MGVIVRGVNDMGVVVVVAMVEPEVLCDDIGGAMSTDEVKTGLSGGGGGEGGDGERIGCTGGGSVSEKGIPETSPVLPTINGDSAEGGNGGSIRMLLRRGEPACNGEALRSGDEAEEGTRGCKGCPSVG